MYAYAGNNPLTYVDPFGLSYQICDGTGNCTKNDLSDEEFEEFKKKQKNLFRPPGKTWSKILRPPPYESLHSTFYLTFGPVFVRVS